MKLLKLVPDHTNLDFMRWRNLALVISLIATVASIAFTAYRGLNLGVDFVGGQLIRVDFPQPIDVEQLRGRINSMHLGEASITEFGGPKTFQIRLPKPGGGDASANVVASRVKQEVEKDYPGARIDLVDTVRARSARSWPATARLRSHSRCSGSRFTSGSASNGSSVSERC